MTAPTSSILLVENEALVLDLVEWVAVQPRPYADVMEACRTSCRRLTIWEDAVNLGFAVRDQATGSGVGTRDGRRCGVSAGGASLMIDGE